MNLDEMTIGQFKELKELFTKDTELKEKEKHGAIGQYCIIRTYASGVFFGRVKSVLPNDGRSRCELQYVRRLHRWKTIKGISLSDLALHGIDVENSKICSELPCHFIEDAIEFIPATEDTIKQIKGAKTYEY